MKLYIDRIKNKLPKLSDVIQTAEDLKWGDRYTTHENNKIIFLSYWGNFK